MGDYQHCHICQDIPDKCNYFTVGGEVKYDDMPRAASQLETVGAPFYNDDLNSSKTLIKVCPHCDTHYEWDYEYEFLVGGSEDDVILTRLSDEEGRRRANMTLARIKATEAAFREKAASAIRLMKAHEDPQTLYNAIDLFGYAQLVQGFDISFAIPDLIQCLARLQALDGYESPIKGIQAVFLFATSNPELCPLIIKALDETGNSSEAAQKIRKYAVSTLKKRK